MKPAPILEDIVQGCVLLKGSLDMGNKPMFVFAAMVETMSLMQVRRANGVNEGLVGV